MFFFKRKTIVLDCLTSDNSVYEFAKVSPTKNFIPKWWREIPLKDENNFAPRMNMRFCAGFLDYFTTGFVIPLWSDLDVEVGPIGTEEYAWQFSDQRSSADSHDPAQWGNFFSSKDFLHLKLHSPWYLKTKKNVNFMWSEPTWNILSSGVRVLPGIVNYHHHHSTNTNLLLARTNISRLYKLKFNTPLAHLTPLTEDKVVLKHHLVSKQETDRLEIPLLTFNASYYTRKVLRDSKAKNKCPFHRNK